MLYVEEQLYLYYRQREGLLSNYVSGEVINYLVNVQYTVLPVYEFLLEEVLKIGITELHYGGSQYMTRGVALQERTWGLDSCAEMR